MYEGVKTWNPFVGCRFGCVYCKPSFQRQAKRQKRRCELCYRYEPHFHPERLNKVPKAKVVFACAYGDIAFAKVEWLEQILETIEKHDDKTFYLQTKDPRVFEALNDICGFPKNVLLGITLETNLDEFNTPSRFKKYEEISKAPKPEDRWITPNLIDYVTIEPILDFDLETFVYWIRCLSPKFVYIGYDNHNCKLPEPRGEKTLSLIRELSKFTEVRLKTIRPAWYENNGNTVFKRLSDFSSSSRHPSVQEEEGEEKGGVES
ncbi:DUF5131 family protein [Archaeoglobus profundus]|uniref:Gp37Gp68 family protein n=1 Tax=Archaeoglobus profundus (strain DSM 5631 / JCM 9629 / NBRC 100127 / Av18) TaxID=572546 RepID=D2RI48_ARCPA|nr:DUF5131 family protein [Archaeoglobus profundus]ADB57973.1 hypothetical protein Arcpr_0912 [Archaeoglobus profundus DSM 5631]